MKVSVGDVFERLTVVEQADTRFNKKGWARRYWHCRCECGGTKVVEEYSLTHKRCTSCGCKQKEQERPVHVGDVFERLTVIAPAADRTPKCGQKIKYWLCRCECGNTKEIMQRSLVHNHTKSCGCKRKEQATELARSGQSGWKKHHRNQGHQLEIEDWDEASREMDRAYVEAVRAAHPEKPFIEVIECKSPAGSFRLSSPSRSAASGLLSLRAALSMAAG